MLIIRRRTPAGTVRRIPLGGPNVYVVIVTAGESRSVVAGHPVVLAESRSTISVPVRAVGENETKFSWLLLPTAESLLHSLISISATGEYAHSAALLTSTSAAGEFRSNPLASVVATAEARLASAAGMVAQGEGGRLLLVERFGALGEYRSSVAAREAALGEFAGLAPLIASISATAESLIDLTRSHLIQAEYNSRISQRITGAAEYTSVVTVTAVASQIVGAVEILSRVAAPAIAAAESLHRTLTVTPAQGENVVLTLIRVSPQAQGEARASISLQTPAQGEVGNFLQQSVPGTVEVLHSIRRQAAALGEVLGYQAVSVALLAMGEFRGSQGSQVSAGGEARVAIHLAPVAATAEVLSTIAQRSIAVGESLAPLLRRIAALGEAEGQNVLTIDLTALGEVSGALLPSPSLFTALGEYGPTIASITFAQGEDVALLGIDPRSALRALAEAGWLEFDKTRATISSGRVRLITVPYTAPQIQAQPFDPLAALSLDTFGFDLTADAGGATIASNTWSATFDPGSTQAFDDVPVARIVTTWSPTTIHMTNPLDNTLQTIQGTFALAMIGTCPASAIGGTYTIVAHIIMSDTRELRISSSFLCTETT